MGMLHRMALALLAVAVAGCANAGPTPAPGPASAPTSSAATSSATAPTAPPAAGGPIPADLRLPNEGERSTAADFTDWTTDNSPGQAWLLDPCRPTAYPTDTARVGFRTVSRSGPEAYDARQLAAYPSVEVATEAVAGFRRALAACSTGGDPAQGTRWQWAVADPVDVGDEGFLAASTTGGPQYASDGERIAVTRVGSMVFLAYGRGEFYTAEIDEAARNAQRVAEEFVASR